MPDTTLVLIVSVVFLALAFDFINGFHDTANAIATSVLTRALSMRNAVLLSAGCNFFGAVVMTGVAQTIAKGVVEPALVSGVSGQVLVLAALIAAVGWNLFTWWKGLPSSSSHALIGGVVGAALAAGGAHVLNGHGLGKIFLVLVVSPILGFVAGRFFMILVRRIFANQSPSKLNRYFRWLQIGSASFMAFTHGSNDAQKSMGVITLALVVANLHTDAQVIPMWVKLSCASAMAVGTASGGWRIIKTLGKNIMTLQPIHGFVSETSAAMVILASTLFRAPVSTTHVISSSIMGTGSATRLSAVRWNVVGQIVVAWLMTLPVCAGLGAVVYLIAHFGFGL